MDSLKDKTVKGLFWGAVNSGSMQLLNIIIGICLGRLLMPEDYALIGMITIFTAIAGNLQDCGFSTALINLKDIKPNDYNSVFWFNVLMGAGLYIILFFSAPLIAAYFHQPALIPLSRFVFLSFVIASLGIAHGAYMVRNLMNKEKAIISFVSLVCSGSTGVALAFLGYGYWSFAWQQVTYIFVLNIGRFYYVEWRPNLRIDFKPVKQMFGFSNKILITAIVSTVSQNILTFIFGRVFPIKAVGNFTQAFKWNTMAHSFVSNTVIQVAQPVFAQLNEESERQLRAFRKMLRFTSFIVFPAMFGFAFVAPEFIVITISDKWIESVPLLQMLCLGGAFIPLHILYQNLVISKGESGTYMWCNIAQILVQIALILTVYRFGIEVMVLAYSLLNVVWIFVWQYFAHRLIGIRLFDAIKDVLPFAAIAFLTMFVSYWIAKPIEHIVLLLVAKILLAGAIYFAAMKLSHAKIMEECLQYLLKKKRNANH